MKQAVTNITECGCMKSPVPIISCRSLQHKCFVRVVKIDWFFPCISMTKEIKEYCSNLSLPPSVCVYVCGFPCISMTQKIKEYSSSLSLPPSVWVCGWLCARERERRGVGARGVISRQKLHEFSNFTIISLPCPLTITTLHIHILQLINTGQKAVIY